MFSPSLPGYSLSISRFYQFTITIIIIITTIITSLGTFFCSQPSFALSRARARTRIPPAPPGNLPKTLTGPSGGFDRAGPVRRFRFLGFSGLFLDPAPVTALCRMGNEGNRLR
jgi:hypothetical protein